MGICGGEQQYLVDRVTTMVNYAYHASYAFIDQVYGADADSNQVLPEGVMVSADRRTGLFCCSYSEYTKEGQGMMLNGTYTLRQKHEVTYHVITLTVTEEGADPISIDISMRLCQKPYGKMTYEFSHCRVNDIAFPTDPLKECHIAAGPIRLTKDGSILLQKLPTL